VKSDSKAVTPEAPLKQNVMLPKKEGGFQAMGALAVSAGSRSQDRTPAPFTHTARPGKMRLDSHGVSQFPWGTAHNSSATSTYSACPKNGREQS